MSASAAATEHSAPRGAGPSTWASSTRRWRRRWPTRGRWGRRSRRRARRRARGRRRRRRRRRRTRKRRRRRRLWWRRRRLGRAGRSPLPTPSRALRSWSTSRTCLAGTAAR
ncbi:hypothetical protein EMIHUDRAFT_460836 [Emiliania huxleyi CCMP1516]|uniref:Uncharacterized protein n=2 Tax=Emiliania huxleyi TaxID=2903 RepID=A0A0D3IL67_EMIH1|nr:hypothetical protein EMIHUDRAFT_460836 [Emiliania huxleyi CCMP1516]EOD12002.1 hypothetical protein EMIHUDRAFT_460836 [Emiliania huxleyi CCMP1516]|eukprot:XP_005764431.1 hypothetical protein EMIHUDRAFT_460836 [Emiliania huxleyi CCMP1516]